MSNSGGVISAPVDVKRDIAGVLGVQSGDVGELCQSAAINPWSKYKPFRHSSVKGGSSDRASKNYGNDIAAVTLLGMQAAARDWAYNKPRGGAYSEPFRVLDFDGYDHNAVGPTFVFSFPAIKNNAASSITYGGFVDGNSLSIADLQSDTLVSGIDTDYPNPPYSLDDFYLMFVVFAGTTLHVYNTGVKLSNAGGISLATFASNAFRGVSAGSSCLAIACLALTDYLAVGDTQLDPTGTDVGFCTNTFFIPLNFTTASAEVSLTMGTDQPFTGMALANLELQYPSTGYIDWKMVDLVISCDSINVPGTSFAFTVKLYVYRNGSLVPGGSPYPTYIETVAYYSALGRYYFQFSSPAYGSWPGFVPATDTAKLEIEYDGGVILSVDVTNNISGPRTS